MDCFQQVPKVAEVAPTQTALQIRKKKKITGGEVWTVGRMAQQVPAPLPECLQHNVSLMRRSIVHMQQVLFSSSPKGGPATSDGVPGMLQNGPEDEPVDCLVVQILDVDQPPAVEERDHQDLGS